MLRRCEMNTNLPGYTAEASLYFSKARYRSRNIAVRSALSGMALLQLRPVDPPELPPQPRGAVAVFLLEEDAVSRSRLVVISHFWHALSHVVLLVLKAQDCAISV